MDRTMLTSALVTSLFVTGLASATPGGTTQPGGTVAVTGITPPDQSVTVPAECEAAAAQTARVVCTAEAFLATLSSEQQAEVVLPLTQENAVSWSNEPAPVTARNGIELGGLSEPQRAAAEAVVKAATGSAEDEGFNEAAQLLMADDVINIFDDEFLASLGDEADIPPVVFSSDSYHLAFLGTPSTTGTWMLQFGGHHLALNITYRAGEVASATPYHTAVEPLTWTLDGATYAPLESDRDAMAAMLAGLNDEQLARAQLSETFSDFLLGPGQDGQFPATKEGLAVSSLSDEQKALVLAAMRLWVEDADAATAAEPMGVYEAELGDTYISFSGDASLSNDADYVRIDGPSVWIELVCQPGTVFQDQIHYHTVWRDHERDYGAEYSF